MLDLMTLCWSENPSERPSLKEINKYVSSFEFGHLLDVVSLDGYEQAPLLATTMINSNLKTEKEPVDIGEEQEPEDEGMIDLWIVKNCVDDNEAKVEIVTYEVSGQNCLSQKVIDVCSEKIEAICVFKKQVWCLDSMKCIYIFCAKTYNKINQYLLNVNLKESSISTMLAIECIDKIVICTSDGCVICINAIFKDIKEELSYSVFETNVKCLSCVPLQAKLDKK